jgi:hypothetical protein
MTNSNFISKPFIRLTGSWLKEAGFNIGSNYKIDVQEKKLVLEVIQGFNNEP